MNTTQVSLLERLRQPADQAAWERFVKLYTPLLGHWARRLGLDGPDADDLIQDVFTLLVRKLPEFRYDPRKRFRAWLWTVTANLCRDRRRRQLAAVNMIASERTPDPPAPDDVEAVDEADYRQYVVRRAMELMQAEFQPATWKAFWEFVVRGRPASEVAHELGMTENAIYLTRGRVLRRLRAELVGLLD